MAGPVNLGKARTIAFTPSCEASSLDADDVIFATETVTGVFQRPHGAIKLDTVQIIDKADQGTAIDLILLDSDVAIGTEDAAVSITDADAESIIGVVSIAAADFDDHIANQAATLHNVGLILQGGATTSLFVGGVSRSGTPTYGAAGLVIKLGFEDYA